MGLTAAWRCPVCGLGVAPDQKTCDHAGTIYGRTQWPPWTPFQPISRPTPTAPGKPFHLWW